MKKISWIILSFILMLVPVKTWAINEVNIYLFYSDNCDICSQEKVYLDALKQRYPNMRIYYYETSSNDNYNLMIKAKSLYGQNSSGVPFTVIGDTAYLGFSQNKKALFQKAVYTYSKTAYDNKLGKELNIDYRNDLEGQVEEYKDNDNYQIEESSGISQIPTTKNTTYNKYKISFYLIGAGIILAIIAGIVYMRERKR